MRHATPALKKSLGGGGGIQLFFSLKKVGGGGGQLHYGAGAQAFPNALKQYIILYKLLFSRGFYFREFREPDPRENFHFNSCLFIVMTTSEKSRN